MSLIIKILYTHIFFLGILYPILCFGADDFSPVSNHSHHVNIIASKYNIGDELEISHGPFNVPIIQWIGDINNDGFDDYIVNGEPVRGGINYILYTSIQSRLYNFYDLGVSIGKFTVVDKGSYPEICLPPGLDDYIIANEAECRCYKYINKQIQVKYINFNKSIFKNELNSLCPS